MMDTTALAALWKQTLGSMLGAWRPGEKQRRLFRAQWSKPGNRDGFLAERLYELTNAQTGQDVVDDKTWADLEFPQIFTRMDTTASLVGSQVLYRQLHRIHTDPDVLADRHVTREVLTAQAPLREKIQMMLWRFGKRSRSHLVDYLFGSLDDVPTHRLGWSLWCLVCVAIFAAAIVAHLSPWIWIAVLFVNFVLILKTHWQVTRDNEAMVSCMALIHTADALAALHEAHPDVPQLARLHAGKTRRARMRRALRWLFIAKREPFSWLSIWLNLTCAMELVMHACAIHRFRQLRKHIIPDFELVGELDASIAVASFLQQFKAHCRPEFTDAANLVVVDGCHPLLPDGVTNSICLEQHSALVTGSNMAGKTTFIKMLGINVVLARTLGFCLASRAVIPRVRVLASIQGSHSVASGKSHYFAEVERIKSFFDTVDREHFSLLIIDELFSGTNTVERIAIARSVLETLAGNAIVLTTTHDVELQTTLKAHYDCCHFQEDPDVDGYFDYRLRQGPTRARNAIRLLAEMGFPPSVTAKAMALAVTTSTASPVE
ncbi:MAG TPA: hypothetical protein VFG67_06085 [Oleiagrimonas sp.]|nr:hypothetical protein [Oleiagrimonas sp.]